MFKGLGPGLIVATALGHRFHLASAPYPNSAGTLVVRARHLRDGRPFGRWFHLAAEGLVPAAPEVVFTYRVSTWDHEANGWTTEARGVRLWGLRDWIDLLRSRGYSEVSVLVEREP